MPNIFAPSMIVPIVATNTNGADLMKNVTKLIPAALPTMMLGTELISVSSPPIFVSNPSIRRNPSIRFTRPSFLSDTPVSDPTMIIAVTLFNTAEKTTVISP